MRKVSISKGNAKMGSIPSVSLPACVTCNPAAPCFQACYARRMEARRSNVHEAYTNNLAILREDMGTYWRQVRAAASMVRFFRFHVSGDIPDLEYFFQMVITAEELPGTRFLAFTKQYEIVNAYLAMGYRIPDNLKVIFSNWGTWKCGNQYGLPVCEVIFPGDTPQEGWKVCGGNCTTCACQGIGCWEVQPGETIAIYKH